MAEDPVEHGLYVAGKSGQEKEFKTFKKETETGKELDFLSIQQQLKDRHLDAGMRQQLLEERQEIIEEVADFDDGGYIADLSSAVLQEVKYSEWDQVYNHLITAADNLDRSLMGIHGASPRWRGVVKTAVEGEAARLVLLGIEKKAAELGGVLDEKWLRDRAYTEERLDRLENAVKEKALFSLLPDAPEELVGKELPQKTKEESSDTDTLAEFMRKQEELMSRFEAREITMEQLFQQQQDIQEALTSSLSRQPAREERERWVDVEYKQEFYTRFTPNLEPRFYTLLTSEERESWDARWQLARAAYYKKATSSFPEKYKECQDVSMLSREMLKTLYEIPGVQPVLETYARSIVKGEKVKVDDVVKTRRYEAEVKRVFDSLVDRGEFTEDQIRDRVEQISEDSFSEMSFWDCASVKDFEDFRRSLREGIQTGFDDQQMKEADAVAWNLVTVFCLPESMNSRYSTRGELVFGLPTFMGFDDFRGALHPQERYEGKMLLGQSWGAFTSWGLAQMERIRNEVKQQTHRELNHSKGDFIIFEAADPDNSGKGGYWTWKVLEGTIPTDDKSKDRAVVLYVPEVCPVIAGGSFWEDTKCENKHLLEFLLDGKTIPWDSPTMFEDTAVIWQFGKINKSAQLLEYFNPGKPMEQKKGGAKVWADPLKEIVGKARLKLRGKLDTLRKTRKTFQTSRSVKDFAVYAAFGGVADPTKKEPTFNVPGGISPEADIIWGALNDRNIRLYEDD